MIKYKRILQIPQMQHCPKLLFLFRFNTVFAQNKYSFMSEILLFFFSVCGGMLTATRAFQTIYSHLTYLSGELYPVNQDCMWKINSPKKKQKILIYISYINLENEPCQFDYVTLYDGLTLDSPIIAKLCGSRLKESYYATTGNNIRLVFKTDDSINGKGFQIKYKRIRSGKVSEHQMNTLNNTSRHLLAQS